MIRTYIDGSEVTDVTLDGASTHSLGKPYTATIHMPLDYAGTDDFVGLHLKVVGDAGEFPLATDGIDHHGRILNVSENDDENKGTVEITSYGGDEIWGWRPARDGVAAGPDQGNFSKPTFITRNGTAPQVMEEILTQSADGSDPGAGEGPMELALGSFAAGGVDITGAPTNWPMTIAQVRALLQDTGELDVIVTPIDSGGNIGQVDCYNGNYGTDRSGSVIFEYATGAHNVQLIKRTRDMTNLRNKVWYYLGPKIDDQHWRRNITGDDPGLPGNISGGAGIGGAIPTSASYVGGTLGDAIAASRTQYLARMDIRILDSYGNESDAVPLYWRLWQVESFLGTMPRTMVHVTPVVGVTPSFDIGDIIGVGAGADFRGGFGTAGQRVYERTVNWDTEGNISLGEIQTSGDQ